VAAVGAALLASWTLPSRVRPIALIAGGAGVLAIVSWPSLICLGIATGVTYAAARLRRWRLGATLAVSAVIAALYLALLSRAKHGGDGAIQVLLPLGMGYYVLRLLHYMIEMERRGFRSHTFVEYACYQFFPATLPIGPINRFDDFLRDLRRRRWDGEQFSAGASRILGGLVMLVLVGDLLLNARIYPWLHDLAAGSRIGETYADTLRFWLDIYVQFSGYSSIAIGVGALMGFTLPENFNLPFLARNIGDFWRRWHMTLSSWCRDYIYTPTLAVWRRPALASLSSMLVLGLWHQVSLHYVFWGLYHGLGLAVWRRFSSAYAVVEPRLPNFVRRGWSAMARVVTLNFVIFSYPTANALEALVRR
jgi:alginate O-acetyltransferase complex protein AlgI